MAHPDREADPQFTQPVRQIMSMLIALALAGAGVFLALPRVMPVFEANPYLNSFIVFVFAVGVVSCFLQVAQLVSSVRWIEAFARDSTEREGVTAPRLLAPLAALLRSRSKRMQIAASSSASILDSVATRIDEARDVTRYIVNLLVFLGLLGTFYGLATTVPALVDTIRGLAPKDGETGVAVFNRLMTGLEAQLGGMGVAFASSLLGLSGSLVVGLLELFAGHGQNRFYRELEEWLSTITRVGFASEGGDSSVENNVVAGVLDHMAEQMETLQDLFEQSDVRRAQVDEKLGVLADAVERLTLRLGDQSAAHESHLALERIVEGQERMISAMEQAAAQSAGAAGAAGDSDGFDAESRMRLRSIDVQMLRILEEISAGRQETMTELRSDIAALGRALGQNRSTGPRKMRLAQSDDGTDAGGEG